MKTEEPTWDELYGDDSDPKPFDDFFYDPEAIDTFFAVSSKHASHACLHSAHSVSSHALGVMGPGVGPIRHAGGCLLSWFSLAGIPRSHP